MTLTTSQVFWFSLVIKMVLAWFIPLVFDEYYYFLWGQYLSLSYFDHPPLVGWLMALSQPLRPIGEGAIRWPFILVSHATLYIWLEILKNHLSQEKLRGFLLIGLLNPLWGWGAFIATPDIPLLFFWSLALYFSKNILVGDDLFSYLGLAASLGLGFLSKYQVVLFLPSLLLVLWQQRQLYKLFQLRTLMAILVALVFCSPVFMWNYWHDWVSIDFQWKHGMAAKHWRWTDPIEYFFSQLFIIFPTFIFFVFQKERAWTRNWLLPFVAFPYLFFFYSACKAHVEGNWVIMALPSIYALSVLESNAVNWNRARKIVIVWAGLLLLSLGLVTFSKSLPENKIPLFQTKKFANILDHYDESRRYFAFSYQLASYLSFKKQRLICKIPVYGRPDHFQFIAGCQDLGEQFYYITQRNDRRNFAQDFPGYQAIKETIVDKNFKIVEVVRP